MEQPAIMSVFPDEHPPIPDEVSAEDIIAIVTVYDPQASSKNRDTPFRKTRLAGQRLGRTNRGAIEGCHIFLHRIDGQPCFTLGRSDSKGSSQGTRDIYLPGTKVGMRQFVLIPIWDSDVWRLESASETVATVNGVPIQILSNRTKKNREPLPHAIHLKQDTVNQATVSGLQIDIWLLKTVREVYPTKIFSPQPLHVHLQNVANRPETWARDRYILGREQVSTNSFRVVERFTGEIQTAKLFRNEQNGQQLRDDEFLKFNKQEVDASIVQYLQSVEINDIPAVITTMHEGFTSYAAAQAVIKEQHPGVRFSIASKLLRRIFSALEFLHFHRLIHGQVSQESVLLRLVNNNAESVLLVNYSNATSFANGTPAPLQDMIDDGQAAMEIVEDCCDIWQLRKSATKDALNEEWMAKKTTAVQKEFEIVQRVVSDFFELKGGSRTSEKGKNLLRLLDLKQNNWHICQNDQVHNATRREVGTCFKSNIDEMVQDWEKVHPSFRIGEKQSMLLSLGHPWLDSLASQLYHRQWNTTPREVCAKYKEFAGDVEEPWQTFEVKKTLTFTLNGDGFDSKPILAWLASCCEIYPEWRQTLEMECENHVRPQDGSILRKGFRNLRDALETHGRVPPSMLATLDHFIALDAGHHVPLRIEETYHIWHHVPSRMFNLSQLQRPASPDRFLLCVNEGNVRCDNYAEVRGEPKLQGCYAPLSLLSDFAEQFGLTIPRIPDHTPLFPTFDPSDFSQTPAGRIILARTGLLAFASVTRIGNQFVFHAPKYPKEFETGNTFLPTYFGDMKVLPQPPNGIYEYARPDHWSKFKTAEEIEAAADVGKRTILQPKGPLKKVHTKARTNSRVPSPTTSTHMDIDESALSRMLKQRELIRSQARPPTKRNSDAQSSEPNIPTAKRSRPSGVAATAAPVPKAHKITMSFVDRATQRMERAAQGRLVETSFSVPRNPNTSFYKNNANVLSSPPRAPVDQNQSFTIAAGSFNLEDDWKQAEEWLNHLPAEDEEPQLQGLFGFDFHHSHLQDGSDTEEETDKDGTSTVGKDKGKGKAIQVSPAEEVATATSKGKGKALTTSFTSLQPDSQLVTPRPSSPVMHHPAAATSSFGHRHGVSTSNLAGVPLDPNHASSSATQPAAPGPAYPTPFTPMLGIEKGISTNPSSAINNWVQGQANAQDGDDDMPDTDVESFNEDSS